MNLLLAPTYQPDANEVLVDFRSTLDDLVTVTVADQIVATLYCQTTNAVGTTALNPLNQITITSGYVQPEQNYFFRFRNPQRRMDLVITVQATYGPDVYSKTAPVGDGVSSFDDMLLPENPTWEIDPLRIPPDQGTIDEPLTPVAVVQPPEQQNLITRYDFTIGAPAPDFDPLTYAGGNNRLLLSNRTNAYFLQTSSIAPWRLSAYLFLEQGITNLIPGSFFLSATNSVPNGFAVDANSALLTQAVALDSVLATGAQVWSLRFRQSNKFTPYNNATISVQNPVPVTAGQTYCLSAYAQVKSLMSYAAPQQLTFKIEWLAGVTPLSTSQQNVPVSEFQALGLGSMSAVAPTGATQAQLSWSLYPVDPGADIEMTFFAPQFEPGSFPTSRTQGVRQQDTIAILDYNAASQKIRLECIPGFASGQDGIDRAVFTGPITVTLTASSTLDVDVGGHGTLSTPLVFAAGDLVDFTVEHLAGQMVNLYVAGVLMASAPLPAFSATPATLTGNGTGMEITALTVFSRA